MNTSGPLQFHSDSKDSNDVRPHDVEIVKMDKLPDGPNNHFHTKRRSIELAKKNEGKPRLLNEINNEHF